MAPAPQQSHGEPKIQGSLVEGMFVRASRPEGAFAEELRAIGIDLRRLETTYPLKVWRQAQEVGRRHLYPELDPEEGHKALGRRFVDGFFDTIIGKVLAIPLPLIGTARVVQRLPKSWSAARPDITITTVQEGERRWRVSFQDPHPSPDFYAGVVEGAGKRTGAEVKAVIENRAPASFDIVITW